MEKKKDNLNRISKGKNQNLFLAFSSNIFLVSSHKKPVMAKNSPDFTSTRHFHWTKKVGNEGSEVPKLESIPEISQNEDHKITTEEALRSSATAKRKLQAIAISKLRSALTLLGKRNSNLTMGLGPQVVGTLFGNRRGHVHFAFQKDPTSHPAFLIELATPISGLVREMATGLVRIALECDKEKEQDKKAPRLLEEPLWRAYCNGKKCGFGMTRACGPKDWKVLKSVEPISMGAGVLPGSEAEAGSGSGSDGEVMYMRAKFERIVGSRDSEAFYMMNPDGNGAPELSIYLLRV